MPRQLPVTSVAPTAAGALDVTGSWRGTLTYDNGNPGFSFVYTLRSTGESFAGRSTEPNTFGDRRTESLFANISGRILAGGVIEWTKTYDGTGGVSTSVAYYGRFDPRRVIITGRWNAGGNTGRFELRRE